MYRWKIVLILLFMNGCHGPDELEIARDFCEYEMSNFGIEDRNLLEKSEILLAKKYNIKEDDIYNIWCPFIFRTNNMSCVKFDAFPLAHAEDETRCFNTSGESIPLDL